MIIALRFFFTRSPTHTTTVRVPYTTNALNAYAIRFDSIRFVLDDDCTVQYLTIIARHRIIDFLAVKTKPDLLLFPRPFHYGPLNFGGGSKSLQGCTIKKDRMLSVRRRRRPPLSLQKSSSSLSSSTAMFVSRRHQICCCWLMGD